MPNFTEDIVRVFTEHIPAVYFGTYTPEFHTHEKYMLQLLVSIELLQQQQQQYFSLRRGVACDPVPFTTTTATTATTTGHDY